MSPALRGEEEDAELPPWCSEGALERCKSLSGTECCMFSTDKPVESVGALRYKVELHTCKSVD